MCAQDEPPGQRVDRDVLRRSIGIDVVAVFWLLPGDPKGQWFEARVESANSRNGTMKIRYLEDGSDEVVNIEEEHVVWILVPVANLEAKEDVMRNEGQVGPKKYKRLECEHGKCVAAARRRLFRSCPPAARAMAFCVAA